MSDSYEDRIVAAVRDLGPDAVASGVYQHMGGIENWPPPSLSKVMSTLASLARRGVLVERWIECGNGGRRRAYSCAPDVGLGAAASATHCLSPA